MIDPSSHGHVPTTPSSEPSELFTSPDYSTPPPPPLLSPAPPPPPLVQQGPDPRINTVHADFENLIATNPKNLETAPSRLPSPPWDTDPLKGDVDQLKQNIKAVEARSGSIESTTKLGNKQKKTRTIVKTVATIAVVGTTIGLCVTFPPLIPFIALGFFIVALSSLAVNRKVEDRINTRINTAFDQAAEQTLTKLLESSSIPKKPTALDLRQRENITHSDNAIELDDLTETTPYDEHVNNLRMDFIANFPLTLSSTQESHQPTDDSSLVIEILKQYELTIDEYFEDYPEVDEANKILIVQEAFYGKANEKFHSLNTSPEEVLLFFINNTVRYETQSQSS